MPFLEVREVAAVGSATSTTRTAGQIEIALFFGGHLTAQLQAGYRDHISRHHLDAAEAALYLVVGNLAQSDAVISPGTSNFMSVSGECSSPPVKGGHHRETAWCDIHNSPAFSGTGAAFLSLKVSTPTERLAGFRPY